MTVTERTVSVWLADVPPSMNAVAGRGSHWGFRNAKKRWQRDLELLLLAERLPRGLAFVEATAVLTFPTRRRRDEDNYRSLLSKSLGDALVNGGWLRDDTGDEYRFGRLDFDTGPKRTTIDLTWRKT